MPNDVGGEGPIPARIMLVGEAPGREEELVGKPFCGPSGEELTRMLHDAGIFRTECFITNVVRQRPPDNNIEAFIPRRKKDITPDCIPLNGKWVKPVVIDGYAKLHREIELVKPNVIVALGNTALWALTGENGIVAWRGSLLEYRGIKVIPTYHPAAVLRQWDWRFVAVHDLRRAKRESADTIFRKPEYLFTIRPSFDSVCRQIEWLQLVLDKNEKLRIAVDIETRWKQIACVGIAWSPVAAICIPFMCIENPEGYWPLEQELVIICKLRELLTHPNCEIVGQNFLYDAQYFAAEFGYLPNLVADTMLLHHVLFAGLPKGLDFLSSLYLDYHRYWKDEGKEWQENMDENRLWSYCCIDAVTTFAVYEEEQRAIIQSGLQEVAAVQMSLYRPVLNMMLRGVRISLTNREELRKELVEEIAIRQEYITFILGHPLNPSSNKQMHALFYNDFKQALILHRKTKQPTLDDAALQKIADREPLLRPLVLAIQDQRSLGVYVNTFVDSEQDADGRIRCSFNIAGTVEYRFSSSENAFYGGMNLQNLPSEKSKSVQRIKARHKADDFRLPNIRKLFIPDPDFTFFDVDLDRADLQVVVWEADDQGLKRALREGLDLHLRNARDLFRLYFTDDDLRIPDKVLELLEKFRQEREFAKLFIHAANYGGQAKTLAESTNISIAESARFLKMWFSGHPGIPAWHDRTQKQLMETRTVTNKFGYRRFYFDRIESILGEALAWIPASTVAIIINKGLLRIANELPAVQLLLQVHDSLAGQYPSASPQFKEEIRQRCLITVPYDDPLIIPTSISTSTVSWGDCS